MNNNHSTVHPFAFLADHATYFLALGLDYSPTGFTHTDDLATDLRELAAGFDDLDLEALHTDLNADFGDHANLRAYLDHARRAYS